MRDLFIINGFRAWITHGSHELGKDLIATNGEYNAIISVKRGDIDQTKWKQDVHQSLTIMIQTPIIHTEINTNLPMKPILIFNGVMTTPVDQQMHHFNEFYKKKGEPEIEIWDINKIIIEFDRFLFSTDLLKKSYLEDIHKAVLSIYSNSIDHSLLRYFVDKFTSLKDNFGQFKLAILYILRRSESQNNPYAFFHFMEYALVQFWHKIFASERFDLTYRFDEIHELYITELRNWIQNLSSIDSESGLFDTSYKGMAEIISYSLRTFDTIRRIGYLCYYYFEISDHEEAIQYVEILLKVIEKNHSSSFPLCEYHYNDISLALTILSLNKKNVEARNWLSNIMDFLEIHYSLGYALLPLGSKERNLFKVILEKKSKDVSKSYLIPLILEFSTILKAREIFDTHRNFLFLFNEMLYEKRAPDTSHEEEIFLKDPLNSMEIKIPHSITYDQWRKFYKKKFKEWNREYSCVKYRRTYLLILIGNVYRDRFFQDIWRNLSLF